MDWSAAIETNREALRCILTTLVAMAGLAQPAAGALASGTGAAPRATLPRHLHRAVLRLLRPAEAAARRLIIVAARGLVVKPPPALRDASPVNRGGSGAAEREGRRTGETSGSPRRTTEGGRGGITGQPSAPHLPTLPLFDPLPRWRGRRRPALAAVPRISFPGDGASAPLVPRQPPTPFDSIDATRLALRLRAVAAALDDLPAHASRFARWQARREAAAKDQAQRQPSPRRAVSRRVWPLRPGRPPGWRAAGRHDHPVHDVLDVLHGLAFWAMERTDTS